MDTSAGPYKNYTVVFLGSDNGHVLKILASSEGTNASFNNQLLEDIDVYNPNKSENTSFMSFIFSNVLFLYVYHSYLPLIGLAYIHSHLLYWNCLLCVLSYSLFFHDQSLPLTLWSVVTLCIILYSWRRFSFVSSFFTVWNSLVTCFIIKKMCAKHHIVTVFLFFLFLGATYEARTGGFWVWSWTGIITLCLWHSPAAWSVSLSAAALTTQIARSE